MNQRVIYFGGDLFDHKHLCGNALLGQRINELSNGKYLVHLPQNKEIPKDRSTQIRDLDLQHLLSCDVAVFNFDGTDLDSGTVVEFCYAKMCDIPSVQFRTDFRLAGDQSEDGDPWNIMASGYPRTKKVYTNSMALYHQSMKDGETIEESMKTFHSKIAKLIIEALDEVCSQPSLFEGNKEKAKTIYQWATKTAGQHLPEFLNDAEIDRIVNSKAQKGLI